MADIKDEGKIVTIAILVEYTGLSRSTFAKLNIRELFAEHGYALIGGTNFKVCRKKSNKTVSDKDKIIAGLKAKNAVYEQECELLRSKVFLMIQK